MNDNQEKINELQARFSMLYNKQKAFIEELKAIKEEINLLKGTTPDLDNNQIDDQRPASNVGPILQSKSTTLNPVTRNKLTKDLDNKLIGGVCSGVAAHFDIDRILVRIIWLILTFVFYGIGAIIYLALWIFLGKGTKNKQQSLEQDFQRDSDTQNLTDKQALYPKDERSNKTTAESVLLSNEEPRQSTLAETSETAQARNVVTSSASSNLEKLVGENLISIIGVAIILLGVGFGVKYSIENDLISPLTRIVMGYISGLALLAFGIKLKKNYNNYSAVLVSGAISIMYFVTYSAYAFYDLMPQILAFAMMVILTVFTVIAAMNYNRQVIAHIGLVGAYAVPFLLSDGSDDVGILFRYMVIINIGILVISLWRYWKPLYYLAFAFTWFIYLLEYAPNYTESKELNTAFTFLAIFFAIFYVTFLAYKLIKKEEFLKQDVLLLLANSTMFYGVGYYLLADHTTGKELLGLFTLGNALIHFIVSVIIYQKKLADKQLFYLITSLVLLFITLAIPVQLDGNWVTLLWSGQAALLFWIGRTKGVSFYETLSFPLMILACFSISQDLATFYIRDLPPHTASTVTPMLNINVLTVLLFITAFIFIHLVNRKGSNQLKFVYAKEIKSIISYGTAGVVFLSLFTIFELEIANYFDQLYEGSLLIIEEDEQRNTIYNNDLSNFKIIWMINFAMGFVTLMSFLNSKKIKSQALGLISIVLMCLTAFLFLGQGLYVLGSLRESYIEQNLSVYYQRGIFNVYIRYISISIFVVMLVALYRCVNHHEILSKLKWVFELFLHFCIIWLLSNELIYWAQLLENLAFSKLGLSILWGVYSLFLIVIGILKRKRHLRIAAIVLIGITLAKLFSYDIAHLDTIAKTIVLVSLGVLLLLISFLYNKFKHSISDE